MSTHLFSSQARRAALVGGATLLVGGALFASPASAAPATDGQGKASATAARADLDVSVADAAKVPVHLSLNHVTAPRKAEKKLLSTEIKGAHNGQPVQLVKADVAHAQADANAEAAKGNVKLANVQAFSPGLPGKALLSAKLLTADANCTPGQKPTATSEIADVMVLGKPVKVDAPSQKIELPALGTVDVALKETSTTSNSGAATALKLSYEINPAKLNVVKASGEIVLSEASCQTPAGAGQGEEPAPNEPAPQNNEDGLAETGGSSATPIIAGVGGLLVAGGGALYWMRRRSAQNG